MRPTAPEEDRTPPVLKEQLRRAIRYADLGVPRSWPLERRADKAVRLLGGGTVSFRRPATVRRAITLLTNSGQT